MFPVNINYYDRFDGVDTHLGLVQDVFTVAFPFDYNLSHEGYYFSEWVDDDGNTYQPGDDISSSVQGTSYRLYAVWIEEIVDIPYYTVTLVDNGITQEIHTLAYGDEIQLYGNPSIPGDVFLGWALAGSEQVQYKAGDTFTMIYEHDIVLEAIRVRGTLSLKDSVNWNNCYVYVKKDGEWKLGLPWVKKNGEWKHSV